MNCSWLDRSMDYHDLKPWSTCSLRTQNYECQFSSTQCTVVDVHESSLRTYIVTCHLTNFLDLTVHVGEHMLVHELGMFVNYVLTKTVHKLVHEGCVCYLILLHSDRRQKRYVRYTTDHVLYAWSHVACCPIWRGITIFIHSFIHSFILTSSNTPVIATTICRCLRWLFCACLPTPSVLAVCWCAVETPEVLDYSLIGDWYVCV